MKVDSIMSAALIALANAVGPLLGANYETTVLTKEDVSDSATVKIRLRNAGSSFGKVISALISNPKTANNFAAATFKNDLVDNIEKYVGVIGNILVFLQLLQLQFSLFDDAKNYLPTEDGKDNYLFDFNNENKTNKQYFQEILGSGKTIREVTHTPQEQNVQGSLNLKYLFSVLNSAFKSLNNPEDQNGYSLEKFLAILTIGPVEVINDRFDDSMSSPFQLFLSDVLVEVILKFLPLDSLPSWQVYMITSLLKIVAAKLITTIFESLLDSSGYTISSILMSTIEGLRPLLKIVIDTGLVPDGTIKDIINAVIDDDQWQMIKWVLPVLFEAIPILGAKNVFHELYSGKPLNLSLLITTIEKLIPLLPENIKKAVEGFIPTLEGIDKDIKNVLPDNQDLNLKNLLLTPIGKIGKQSLVPPAFGGYYLDKSIVEIINDISDKTYVTGQEKLSDFTGNLDNFNFKLSYIKDIFKLIKEYNYEYEGRSEDDQGRNLISILLENLDQTSIILGLKKDGTFGTGSLLDLIFNKILRIDKINGKENDPFYFFVKFLSSLFINLNSPKVDYSESYKTLFSDATNFKFEYQTAKEDEFGTLLGQTLVVNYHNPETNTN
jgi:MOLPALP family lipoprotein